MQLSPSSSFVRSLPRVRIVLRNGYTEHIELVAMLEKKKKKRKNRDENSNGLLYSNGIWIKL